MKILFTGGGTGGHFYPIIAVADELRELVKEYRLIPPELIFMSPSAYNPGMLYDRGIVFKKNTAGKRRLYFSILNFFDLFKTAWGVLTSVYAVFSIYPDVIFGKGGYASFPVLFAGKILRIPVVIHESDMVPGRVNVWAARFAKKIAVSYPDTTKFFSEKKVAYTGQPIRKELMEPLRDGAHEFLKLQKDLPTIFVFGGSQGSQIINDTLVDALPELLKNYQIIHQVGKTNFSDILTRTNTVLLDNPLKDRYKIFDYLDSLAIRMSAGASSLVISRAGSSIFEIATWGLPSIIIPITDSQGDHQRKNAYSYARTGACVVLEEANLTANILISETRRLLDNPSQLETMKKAALGFANKDAARMIAKEILAIALKHDM